MISVSMQSRPAKAEEVAVQSMPPDMILLNLDNGYYYSTNHIGTAVWERCDGRTSLGQIVSEIGSNYNIPLAEIEADVMEFIRHMMVEGLVKIE